MKAKLYWVVLVETVLFKSRNKHLSGLIQSEHITQCVDWNFSDMANPMAPIQEHAIANEQLQLSLAREDGHATGYQMAQAEFEARMAIEMQAYRQQQQRDNALQLQTLLSSAQEGWNLAQADLAESVMRLAVEMASQVVCHVIDVQYHQTLHSVITNAVETLINQDSPLVVRLCSADLSAMESFLPTRLQEREVKWLSDSSLQASQCIVESAGQRVDASVKGRMELAKKLLLPNMQEQRESHA
jgi:flagellar biosynthesis/type III secretory pathway protein FliH